MPEKTVQKEPGKKPAPSKKPKPQQEVVVQIPLSELHPFPDHPFQVREDASMQETAESVKEYGVLVPALARPREDGGYELIAGHRRKHACELAGLATMPVIVRDIDRDAATIIMVDSNLQRENILPSERAKNTLTEDMLQVPKFSDDNGETRTEIVSVDDELYKKLCDRAGAEYGSILLLNTYQYNDNGEYTSIKPFKDDVTQISLINAANEKNTLTIGGILEQSDLKEYGFLEMTPYPVRIVVPDADARSFDWFSMPSDEDDYTEYARSVMDEYFPIMAEDSYVEQGYTVRIARTDAMIKMLNIAIVLAEIVMYGFVILLILMGFTSVISTLTTNIRIRSREFAVLKSVGMTNKSLCRMLYSESIFCVLNALVPGVILGIAIPFFINLSIRKAFPVLYHIPWAALFCGIFVLIGIVFFITRTEIHKLRDKSIIDEIRMDIV